MLGIVKIVHTQHFFGLGNPYFRRSYLFLFFVNGIILALFHVAYNMGDYFI